MRIVPIVATILAGSLPACTDPAESARGDDPQRSAHPGEVRYEVAHLGTLGGMSRGNVINNRGWVAGYSQEGDFRRAILWRDAVPLDLGSLAGPAGNSSVPWPGLNQTGMVVGITETGEADELGQAWSCRSFFPVGTPSGRQCVGFWWDGDEMRPLPTLGGGNGFAASVNNRGQVVGWAETDVVDDPTCTAPQRRQFRAVLWEPRKGRVQELPPLPGDSASAATAINQAGRVVGISGDCDVAVGNTTARHAVIWTDAVPARLPTLGGGAWHTPMDINDSGEIAGFSLGPDGLRAVYWDREGGITDLGTLDGDPSSQAHGINARGQVVGVSGGTQTVGSRAFLWEGGELINLNSLVLPGYGGILRDARHINDAGVITGAAQDADGRIVTFVATPVRAP
jgi:probable HAF family extracellular repeat protein